MRLFELFSNIVRVTKIHINFLWFSEDFFFLLIFSNCTNISLLVWKNKVSTLFFAFFFQVDEELRTYGSATELTGSTACVILIKHGELICANLGDSRAIASLSGLVKTLSTDHNTSNSQERERIFSMGGTIKENRYAYYLLLQSSPLTFLLIEQCISAQVTVKSVHFSNHLQAYLRLLSSLNCIQNNF